MKRLLVIVFLLGRMSLVAEDAASAASNTNVPHPHAKHSEAPRAWLGLQVSRPDDSITVHLPELPPGIGFMVRSVTADGPAAAAGIKPFDILWRLGDQMLVNEGQLAALLRLSKPGDVIALSGFRAGKPLEVELTLGETPVMTRPFPDELVDSAILPGGECRGPMRVFNISDKIASYATDEGRAEIQRVGEVYQVKILGPKDEPIFEGDLSKDGNLDSIPEGWRRRVHALRRGLDHALSGRMAPVRQPRPRVVPPPAAKP